MAQFPILPPSLLLLATAYSQSHLRASIKKQENGSWIYCYNYGEECDGFTVFDDFGINHEADDVSIAIFLLWTEPDQITEVEWIKLGTAGTGGEGEEKLK